MMQAFVSDAVFDSTDLRPGVLLVQDGHVAGLAAEAPPGAAVHHLGPGTLAPGFVDLQVNGGDGVMLNDAPTVATLRRMAGAHGRLGSTAIFPTLITDAPEVTRAAIAAALAARAEGVPGIAGLHLEGPHLAVARKGAHDPALIRPMTDNDLRLYCDTARRLPLMVTLAPETVPHAQIAALAAAGAIVALGHSDAPFEMARAAIAAGATVVTHLFNAMSQLASREPGLVGAALTEGAVSCGLIADGIHVHPATIRAAMAAKAGPGAIFLVTDAMAPAGSAIDRFTLNGRTILRQGGRLTLADGTLAGADLSMAQALAVMTGPVGLPLPAALAMATAIPARVAGLAAGRLVDGAPADFVHLSPDLALHGVWRGGLRLPA
jgi:N-acetylglucosamine-6-phosphate deacetylase